MNPHVVPGARVPRVPAVFCPTPSAQRVVRSMPPLVVVRAPRGFGKTSTVAYWLRSGELDDRRALWLTLAGPTTPEELWAAAHRALVATGLAPSPPDPAELDQGSDLDHGSLSALLAGLRRRLVLVIDGLHLVTDTTVDAELVSLTQTHELLHVVAITRSERPIESIGRATVDTTILSQRELTLGREETMLLATRLGLSLTEQEADRITSDLGGWPAFIRVALLESRRGADGRLIEDLAPLVRYGNIHLADQEHLTWRDVALALVVPDRLRPEDLSVLLEDRAAVRDAQYAITDSASLARRPDGTAAAPGLRAITLEVLRAERPERYRDFNRRMARRRQSQANPSAALRYAVRAEAWELVLELVEENWAELLRDSAAEVDVALSALPADHVARSTRLLVARDYVLNQDVAAAADSALRGGLLLPGTDLPFQRLTSTQRLALRFDGAPSADAAKVLLGRRDGAASSAVPALEAELLTEWALSMLYANDAVIAAYGFALACRRAAGLGNLSAAREAASAAALATALLGHLHIAEQWTAHAASYDAPASPLEQIAEPLTRAVVAGLRLEPYTFPQVSGLQQSRGLVPLVELSRLGAAFAEVIHGRLDRARVELQRYAAMQDGRQEELLRASITGLSVDLMLSEGRLDRAGALLAHSDDGGAWTLAARARHAFYVGGYTETLRLTDGAQSYAATRPRVGMELLLLRACAAWRSERRDIAVDQFATAVGIAEDTDLLLPFLTVPRVDLEAMAPEGTCQREFLERAPLAGTDTHFPKPLRVDELSGAELRVLHELADGLPLAHIGRRLFIAESTVKTHVQRIYRKLGVSSRTAALERARELMLLN